MFTFNSILSIWALKKTLQKATYYLGKYLRNAPMIWKLFLVYVATEESKIIII
jgi:hypothetical protein